MWKCIILILSTQFLYAEGFCQSSKSDMVFKISTTNLILGDRVTQSWSPNIVLEIMKAPKYSFQQEFGIILRNHLVESSIQQVPISYVRGVRYNPEVKRYLSDKADLRSLSGFYLSANCNTVFTYAKEVLAGAKVQRLAVIPRINVGFQSIGQRKFTTDLSLGIGPGFIFSKSTIHKDDLGVQYYRHGILYQGGSGVYTSIFFDVKFGYLKSSK